LLIGCTSALVDPAGRAATVQLSIHFERALRGDLILGEAHIDRSTARLIFASGEIRNTAGEVCVRCQGLVHRLAARAGS
jgi:acyl-coenzyme A thioesterase PaaI-like protein